MKNTALLRVVMNEPSFCFGTDSIRVCVTRTAGMMGPVTFFADTAQPIEPYYVAPWWNEGCGPDVPPILGALRGDFFCAPFGDNEQPHEGIHDPPHGEPANAAWKAVDFRESGAGAALHLVQPQTLRPGEVHKWLAVVRGESVIYARHDLVGMSGPMCLGYHPCHYVPDGVEPGYLSFSPYMHAHTYIEPTGRPEEGAYSVLRPDTAIEDLRRVPLTTGGTTDLTRWPARKGYEDIAIICARPDLPFAWTAFSVPSLGYAWFSLKDPRVLASTMLWMSNGGRHTEPWNGRNWNCIGLEEVTAFFHEGPRSAAKENFLSRLGVPTRLNLSPTRPTRVSLIQGVVRISPDFLRISAIEAIDGGAIALIDEQGKRVETPVDVAFLERGATKDLID